MNNRASNISHEISVKASTENLAVVRSALEEFALLCGANLNAVFDLQLAVDEAFTNIIKHAYNNDENQIVHISMFEENGRIVVQLTDSGKGFDVTNYKKPDVQSRIKQKKRGGVGVYLMTKLMDEVSFNKQQGHNVITLAKHLF